MTWLEKIALQAFIVEMVYLNNLPPDVNPANDIWFNLNGIVLWLATSVALLLRIEPYHNEEPADGSDTQV
jgi:hypothetical protein